MVESRDQLIQSMIHSCAGCSASCISTLLLYPLENIRTLMLIQQQNQTQQTVTTQHKQCVSIISQYYKGISPMLVGNMISYGTYFFWYELLKQKLKSTNTINSLLAGILTSIATNPFWVINTRMTHNNLSFQQTLQQMINREGMSSLFKGLKASLLLVLNPMIQFEFYERLKPLIQRRFRNNQFMANFISGAISKAIATICTFPYIVIRTYLQANRDSKLGNVDMIKQIYNVNGIKGFYTGLHYKLCQSVMNSAMMLATYEQIFRFYKQIVEE